MVKIRLEGLPDEVENLLVKVRKDFNILQESNQYPNRNSKYIRVYLDVECNTGYQGPGTDQTQLHE